MSSLILENDGLVGLKNDVLVGLENNVLVGLENDSLSGLQNDDLDCDGLAMVINDNCEFIFEGRSYWSYTDNVQARRSRTAGIFTNSGMLAARSAIAEERTTAGPRRAKNPRDDLVIPPLLPQQFALPEKSAKTTTKALILLNSSGRMYRSAFLGALTRTGPFIAQLKNVRFQGTNSHLRP